MVGDLTVFLTHLTSLWSRYDLSRSASALGGLRAACKVIDLLRLRKEYWCGVPALASIGLCCNKVRCDEA
jgi:hypothetical protein